MAHGLRTTLTSNLARWQALLAESGLADTHVGGMAGKAVAQFEEHLRDVIARYLERCSIDYDAEARTKLKGKALDDLSPGALIRCVRILNKGLTSCLRAQEPALELTPSWRLLVSQKDFALLGKWNRLRIKLIHHRDEFDERLQENTSDLLVYTSKALDLPLFTLAGDDDA